MASSPKCPELNPVETVWQFMHDNWLSNRIFETYEDIVATCSHAWNRLAAFAGCLSPPAAQAWCARTIRRDR